MNTQNFALSQGLTTASQIARSSNSAIRRCLQVGLVGLSLMVASVGAEDEGKIIVSTTANVQTINLKVDYDTQGNQNPVTEFTGDGSTVVGIRFFLSQPQSSTGILTARVRKKDDSEVLAEGFVSGGLNTSTAHFIEFDDDGFVAANGDIYVVEMKTTDSGPKPAVRFGDGQLVDSSSLAFCSSKASDWDGGDFVKYSVNVIPDCNFVVPDFVKEDKIHFKIWGGGGKGGSGSGSGSSRKGGGGGGGGAYGTGSIAEAALRAFILTPGGPGESSEILEILDTGSVSNSNLGSGLRITALPGNDGKDAADDGAGGEGGSAGSDQVKGHDGGAGNAGGGDGGASGGPSATTANCGSGAGNGNGNPGCAPGGGGGGGSGSGNVGGTGGGGQIEIFFDVPVEVQFTNSNPTSVSHGETLELEVEFRDAFGNLADNKGDLTVTFSDNPDSESGSVTGLEHVVFTRGKAKLDVQGDRAGLVTITATLGAMSADLVVMVNPIAPPPPKNVQVTPVINGLSVSWQAPEEDGGAPILSYTARANPSCVVAADEDEVLGETQYSCVISPLDPNTGYSVSVTANNGVEGDEATAGDGTNGGSNGGSFQPLSVVFEPLPVPTLSFWAMLLLILLSVWVAGQRLMSRRSAH